MNDKFSPFVFKTRGLYMFVALAISILIKFYLGGTTTLIFLTGGLIIMVLVQALRMYSASYLWADKLLLK